MTDTFTVAGVGSWSPLLITGDDVQHPTGTVVHDLIGGDVAATLRPASPRAGTLEVLARDATDAATAVALLGAGMPITLAADPVERSMRFVIVDRITQRTDTDTDARLVTVTIPFREVPA